MSEKISLPDSSSVFQLRYDLPLEAGVADLVRRPVPTAEAEEFCRKVGGQRLGRALIELVNRLHSEYQPPRFFAYYGLIAPGETVIRKCADDGVNRFWWPESPLLDDAVARACVSIGADPRQVAWFYPKVPAEAEDNYIMPVWAVLHDTARGAAAVVPFAVARKYLAFNK